MSNNAGLMRHENKSYKVRAKKYEIGSVGVHWHDFYEIELVLSGEGTHTINNTEYEWKPGEIHFLRLTDFHKISLTKKGYVHLIQLSSNAISANIINRISVIQNNIITYLSDDDFACADMLCEMLEKRLRESKKYNEEIVNNIVELIVNILIDSMDLYSESINDISKNRIASVIKYMNEHFTEDLNLDRIAEMFYVSKSHLCYYFKNSTGTTILNYIKDLRLAYAVKLVLTTHHKSIDIGLECGYTSVSNFLRDFKKKYGVSPMTMRKQNETEKIKTVNDREVNHVEG